MNLHYLKHVPFEGLDSIRDWAENTPVKVTSTCLYKNEPLPNIDTLDGLVIMGGPMSVNETLEHPWMADEKRFIRNVIDQGKAVLGVCLGAQLIADVLGAKIYPNKYKEIGWFPIKKVAAASDCGLVEFLPDQLEVFHWHGETFDLPDGAALLASSDACANQGFIYKKRVIGLQFHLETTPASLRALIDKCADELKPGPYVQTTAEMIGNDSRFVQVNKTMTGLLNQLFVTSKDHR